MAGSDEFLAAAQRLHDKIAASPQNGTITQKIDFTPLIETCATLESHVESIEGGTIGPLPRSEVVALAHPEPPPHYFDQASAEQKVALANHSEAESYDPLPYA